MGTQDLLGVRGVQRIRHPTQNLLEGPTGQSGGMEVGLDHLRGLAGVEAGGVVASSASDRAGDGAGRERLRPTLGDHRVDAAVDWVPHQGGDAGCEPERIEDGDRAVLGAAGDRQEEIVGLGERDECGAGCVEECGGQEVEGLARALRSEDAGRAVPRAPQLPRARVMSLADAPAHLSGIEAGHDAVPPGSRPLSRLPRR